MIARREHTHVGAQLTFTDYDAHRFQIWSPTSKTYDVAYFDALYRERGRVERRICDAKDTGLANLPSPSMAINQAWLTPARCRRGGRCASVPGRIDNPLRCRRLGG